MFLTLVHHVRHCCHVTVRIQVVCPTSSIVCARQTTHRAGRALASSFLFVLSVGGTFCGLSSFPRLFCARLVCLKSAFQKKRPALVNNVPSRCTSSWISPTVPSCILRRTHPASPSILCPPCISSIATHVHASHSLS